MKVVLLLITIGLLTLSVGVLCLSVVQIRLIREVAALRKESKPTVRVQLGREDLRVARFSKGGWNS